MTTILPIADVPLASIVPPLFMLRDPPTPGEIHELAESIRGHGLIEPIVVRPVGAKFEIVAGYRRFMACRSLRMTSLPCVVNEVDDQTAIILGLSENLDRRDASPIRMSQAIQLLQDKQGMTTPAIGKKLGKTAEWISRMIRLAKNTKVFQEAFQSPGFTLAHVFELFPIKSEEKLKQAIEEVLDKRLSSRETRRLVAKILTKPIKKAPTSADEKGDEGMQGIPMTCTVDGKQHPPGQMVKVIVCRDHYESKILPLLKKAPGKDKDSDDKDSDKGD
jgi:ParB family chromosome partitioning protein